MSETGQNRRLLAIGDIHGYHDKLEALLDMVRPAATDQVVFIGDYIDRGPDSRAVLDLLTAFRDRFPGTVFLRGNHEQMLLDWRQSGDAGNRELYLFNGGQATLASYGGGLDMIPEEHLAFIETTRLFHLETGFAAKGMDGATSRQDFLFAHAGVNPDRPLEAQTSHDLLWIREPFLTSPRPCGDLVVVHGHTPTSAVPGTCRYRIAIDSGVYLGGGFFRRDRGELGRLTCCNVLNRQIWQA